MALSSSPSAAEVGLVEYSWWIDDQPHAAWSTSTEATVDSQYMFLQGKHVLYVSARIVGHPESEGDAPVALPFVVDVLAPIAAFTRTDSGIVLDAYDYVSDASSLRARVRETGATGVAGAWTEWQPLSTPFPAFSAPGDGDR